MKRRLNYLLVPVSAGMTAAAIGMAAPLTACDPIPPPDCAAIVSYLFQSEWDGELLTIVFPGCSGDKCNHFGAVTVDELDGASLESVSKSDEGRVLTVRLRPLAQEGGADAGPVVGSFRVRAETTDDYGEPCMSLNRRFDFSIADGAAKVTPASVLAVRDQEGASVAVRGVDGRQVTLEARGLPEGPTEWTVSEGEKLETDGRCLRWRLPDKLGVYLAEVVVHLGEGRYEREIIVLEAV